MGNLPPFPMLSHRAIVTMVQAEAGLSIVGLSVSLLALGYDHIMCVMYVRNGRRGGGGAAGTSCFVGVASIGLCIDGALPMMFTDALALPRFSNPPCTHTRTHTHTRSAKEPVRFHAHMTIILFIFDLLDAILMCMSRTTMSNPYLCDFQGIAITTLEVRASASFLIAAGLSTATAHTHMTPGKDAHMSLSRHHLPPHPIASQVCIVLWNSFMALQVYRWIILKRDTLALRRQLHPALFTYAFGLVFWLIDGVSTGRPPV